MNTIILTLFMTLLYGCSLPHREPAPEKPVRDYSGITVLAYEQGTWKVLPFLYENPND
jgi:uncharacterized protein YceK